MTKVIKLIRWNFQSRGRSMWQGIFRSHLMYNFPHFCMFLVKDYKHFVDFLIENNTIITSSSINGDLVQCWFLFEKFTTNIDKLSCNNFSEYISQFNSLTLGALELSDNDFENTRIKYIDMLKVRLLRDRIYGTVQPITFCGSKKPTLDESSPANCLNKILGLEIHSHVRVMGVKNPLEIHSDGNDLTSLLVKPNASVLLAKIRARIQCPPKPFFEVCQDKSHCKILSNICFSHQEILSLNSLRLSFPSLEKCHRSIEQSKKLFSNEIYQCLKSKIHFLNIIHSNTDVSLGDCSYLDTCHKMKSCRYLHYFSLVPVIDDKRYNQSNELKLMKDGLSKQEYSIGLCFNEFSKPQLPPQWISCDVRKLPFLVLGKFAAIISDPAWDIHMSLPYGTCSDEELMRLPMHELQDEGIMFLWVTGRSIEIGRKALVKWGYKVSDEIIWIKLNQLKRTIVTGRTGHWLNHSKEHLLVGLKGEPSWLNKHIDLNTIVSSTRETLRKPDEVYDFVERLVGPSARKLEFFGRDHNIRPGWVTIGNQLNGTSIHEREMLTRYEEFSRKNKHK